MKKNVGIKVTVIIPVKNTEDYIRTCINSVLEQELEEIEIICVDDGSTDSSYIILKEYEKQYDNIYVLKQNSEGPGVARNKGILNANGKYVCMIDSDDYYPNNNVLSLLYEAAEKKKVLVCGGNITRLKEGGFIEQSKWGSQREGMYKSKDYPLIYGQTRFIYNREFLLTNGIFYPPFIRFEDPPFLLEALLKAKEYYIVEKAVYIYRVEYKDIITNRKIAIELLKGIQMCVSISNEYHLKNLFRKELQYLLYGSIDYLHPYLARQDVEVWKYVKEIIEKMDVTEDYDMSPFTSFSSYNDYICNIRVQFEGYKKGKGYIIYGAGKTAKDLLELDHFQKESVVGVAISQYENRSVYLGYPLKIIDNYKDELLKNEVVIAASEKYVAEMKRNLKRLGVEKYSIVTDAKLKVFSRYIRKDYSETD